MRHFKFSGLVLAIALAFTVLKPGWSVAQPAPPEIPADAYILADLKTGRILAEKNPDQALIPASLTKIMTLYILFDEIKQGKVSLSDDVKISERAWSTQGSKMFVLVGSTVKLEDLVKGITVASGNDACVAVAEHVAGNVESFVAMMNEKARALGLTKTHFVDPHGLSEENRMSPRDFLTLARAYLRDHPEAKPYHSIKEFRYTPPGEHEIILLSYNKLLWSYPGCYGLKTGHISAAGFNIAATCERDGFDVIAIVLGAAKGKPREIGESERADLAATLLDYAYRNFTYVKVAEPGTEMGQARVWKGKGKYARAIAPYEMGGTVLRGKEGALTYSVILKKDLVAPIKAGTVVGEVVFSADGQEVGRAPLIAKEDVPKGNVLRVVWDSLVRALLKAFGRV
ncbi:MAG TPA: D-alanyl-D-alanine carboxypeptidase [Firmicutes bacterium]|nr:D-alanyl-D-alanine carboxypeptidase [Candidatus Fermentithermobacillaceae bacterium]